MKTKKLIKRSYFACDPVARTLRGLGPRAWPQAPLGQGLAPPLPSCCPCLFHAAFSEGLRAGRACALVGSILFFVGRSRGLPENPKSMGWEIHGWEILGKPMNKSRIFGKPYFGKKSRFENTLVNFFWIFKVFGNLYNV